MEGLVAKAATEQRAVAVFVDMNVTVSAQDEREEEGLASGFPFQHGSQFAVDDILRCAFFRARARPNAAIVDGAVAGTRKRNTPNWLTARGVIWCSWLLRLEELGV